MGFEFLLTPIIDIIHLYVHNAHLCDIISEWNYKFVEYIVKDNETQFHMDSCIHKANKNTNICMNL